MNRERDASGRFKRKSKASERYIHKRLEAMNTPVAGAITPVDSLRSPHNEPREMGRRDFLLMVAAGAAVAAGSVSFLREPVIDILEGKITTRYGVFWPIYKDKPLSVEKLPKNLDYFFIDRPMRADEYKMAASELLATSDISPQILEHLAERGIQIIYADAPPFADQSLRNAIYAHKMLLWTEAMSSNGVFKNSKGRPVRSVFTASPDRQDVLVVHINTFLARGFGNEQFSGLTEQVILGDYRNEVLRAIAPDRSIDKLFTVRAISLPRDFRYDDLGNPQRQNLIIVDDSIKDIKLIETINKRSDPIGVR
jgi:hypothetical protein